MVPAFASYLKFLSFLVSILFSCLKLCENFLLLQQFPFCLRVSVPCYPFFQVSVPRYHFCYQVSVSWFPFCLQVSVPWFLLQFVSFRPLVSLLFSSFRLPVPLLVTSFRPFVSLFLKFPSPGFPFIFKFRSPGFPFVFKFTSPGSPLVFNFRLLVPLSVTSFRPFVSLLFSSFRPLVSPSFRDESTILSCQMLNYRIHASIMYRKQIVFIHYSANNSGKITGVSYKWYASVAGLLNLYSVIDGQCTLKVENNCYTENTFYMKQAVLDKNIHNINF